MLYCYPKNWTIRLAKAGAFWTSEWFTGRSLIIRLVLFYLKSALQYLPKNKPLDISDAWRALGRTYADLKDYKHALNNLDSSLYYAHNNTVLIAEVFNERSYIYSKEKNFDKALPAAFYSLALNKKVGNATNISVLYGRLGTIYAGQENYAKANAYTEYRFDDEPKGT